MLCIKQIFALLLFILLIIISLYILPSIYGSIKTNIELQKPRKFHNKTLFRMDSVPQSFHLDDHHNDIDIDLEITYPHATLTVDEPVDISAIAIINQSLFSEMRNIVIGFNAAHAYPQTSEERPGMDLIKTQDNKMTGTTKVFWPIEGKYHANISLEFMHGHPRSTNTVDLITVYPKSEVAQYFSNKTIIDLTFAAYIVGVFGAFNIIYQLWTSP